MCLARLLRSDPALSRTKPHDGVYDRLLCQITETEPKTAMAGPARSIARRTQRNKPTNYHRSGNRWTLFCDNSPGDRGSFSQLYFRRRFTGGAMNQILEVTGSRLWDGPIWSPPRRGCCGRRTRDTSHNESQDLWTPTARQRLGKVKVAHQPKYRTVRFRNDQPQNKTTVPRILGCRAPDCDAPVP